MPFIVAADVVTSQPPERQLTGMPTTCANYQASLFSHANYDPLELILANLSQSLYCFYTSGSK